MNSAHYPDASETLINPAVAVTAPLVPDTNAFTEQSPSNSFSNVSNADFQGGSIVPQTQPELGGAGTCLYFLVCKATTGPLRGLFKVGIAECLRTRYRQHRQVWGEFDLSRSALLRLSSRWEARRLELALHNVFGGPANTESTHTAAQPQGVSNVTATRSWRRHPGRYAEGRSEFYAIASLEQMFSFAETWMKYCGERLAGVRLERGIDPADCEWGAVAGGDGTLLVGKDHGPGLRERQRLLREREYRELEEQIVLRVHQVLDLATAHEERLLWVDLRGWQQRREQAPGMFICGGSFAYLYFANFEPAAAQVDAGLEPLSSEQRHFEEGLDFLLTKVSSPGPQPWRRVRSREICSVVQMDPWPTRELPQPHCAGALRLRVEADLSRADEALWKRFVALAQRVEGRLPRSQQELPW